MKTLLLKSRSYVVLLLVSGILVGCGYFCFRFGLGGGAGEGLTRTQTAIITTADQAYTAAFNKWTHCAYTPGRDYSQVDLNKICLTEHNEMEAAEEKWREELLGHLDNDGKVRAPTAERSGIFTPVPESEKELTVTPNELQPQLTFTPDELKPQK